MEGSGAWEHVPGCVQEKNFSSREHQSDRETAIEGASSQRQARESMQIMAEDVVDCGDSGISA